MNIAIGFPPAGIFHVDPDRVDVDESDVAWSVAVGYRINPYLAAEVEYIDFGTTDIAEHYDLGPEEASIEADVSAAASYTISFARQHGKLVLAPQKPEASTIEVVVDTTSAEASWDLVAEIAANEFLHVSSFPEARFVSRALRKRQDGAYDLFGELELHGTKKNVVVPATIVFVVYYFSLPLLVGYAPALMATKVFGVVNVAYLFALSQFLMAWLIAWAYGRIISDFPSGGGGYSVASKLLGHRAGLVSGSALLVDYVLTITVSIAAAGKAIFSLLPPEWSPWMFPAQCSLLILLTALNLRGVRAPFVVAVDRLPELRTFAVGSDYIELGAALTLSECERLLDGRVPLLDALWPQFASRLIRNGATLGGNIGTGSPIGDAPPALLALRASVVLAGPNGEREVALDGYFTGYRRTVKEPGELIKAVRVPLPVAPLTAFHKIAKRRFDDISSVAVAFALDVGPDGMVADAAIGLGGVAATPVRATATEAALVGRPWDAETVRAAAAVLRAEGTPIDDHRASAAYRTAMLGQSLLKFHAEVTA